MTDTNDTEKADEDFDAPLGFIPPQSTQMMRMITEERWQQAERDARFVEAVREIVKEHRECDGAEGLTAGCLLLSEIDEEHQHTYDDRPCEPAQSQEDGK